MKLFNRTKKDNSEKEHEIVMKLNEAIGTNLMVPSGRDCREFDFEQLERGAEIIYNLKSENERLKNEIEVLRKYIKV